MQAITVYLLLLGAAVVAGLGGRSVLYDHKDSEDTNKLLKLVTLPPSWDEVKYHLKGNRSFRCDYKYFEDAKGWLKLHRIPTTWHEARLRCHLEGAKFASPLNAGIQSAMKTLIDQETDMKRGVFTGIHTIFSSDYFFSDEGIPLRNIPHKWANVKPDKFIGRESCILTTPEGGLANVPCEDKLPYLCYKKASDVTPLTDCGTVDPDYILDNRTGSCYKFHRIPRTWSSAYMACASEGGYLAIINSDIEAEVIEDVFYNNPDDVILGDLAKDVAFVGIHNWNGEGEWLTIEGQTLQEAGYAKFSSGEPNNEFSGEYCGAVYRSGLFNDLWCDRKYAFICEKSPDSLLYKNND